MFFSIVNVFSKGSSACATRRLARGVEGRDFQWRDEAPRSAAVTEVPWRMVRDDGGDGADGGGW